MHHPQQSSQYPPSHLYAQNNYQMHQNGVLEPPYHGDGRGYVPQQMQAQNHGDIRNVQQQTPRKIIRVQDDPHHCDWAEKKIRSLSICIVGLLFIMVIQGTIQAMLVDKVYNGKFLDALNERT